MVGFGNKLVIAWINFIFVWIKLMTTWIKLHYRWIKFGDVGLKSWHLDYYEGENLEMKCLTTLNCRSSFLETLFHALRSKTKAKQNVASKMVIIIIFSLPCLEL